jgi:predicted urease superfamily metal-dependent hydrolase
MIYYTDDEENAVVRQLAKEAAEKATTVAIESGTTIHPRVVKILTDKNGITGYDVVNHISSEEKATAESNGLVAALCNALKVIGDHYSAQDALFIIDRLARLGFSIVDDRKKS